MKAFYRFNENVESGNETCLFISFHKLEKEKRLAQFPVHNFFVLFSVVCIYFFWLLHFSNEVVFS